MARPGFWQRSIAEYVDDSGASEHVTPEFVLNQGQTLTRIRLRWQVSHFPDPIAPGEGVGSTVTLGLIMQDILTDPAAVPRPTTAPDEEWLWWESGILLPTLVANDQGVAGELDVYPLDNGAERDIKAQRTVPADGTPQQLWVVTSTTPGNVQATHYLSYSYSAYILDVP